MERAEYHRLSGPQVAFGEKVLARLELAGAERVLDAGCGTGRLTAQLLDRLPGRARHLSRSLAQHARRGEPRPRPARAPRSSARRFRDLPFRDAFDVVFSTATFHWVLDHPALFRAIHRALRSGGRLHAQCGGGPNLARLHARDRVLMAARPSRRISCAGRRRGSSPTPTPPRERLAAAGFVDIVTSLEAAPVVLPDATRYHDFLTTVIYRDHLTYLPTDVAAPRLHRRPDATGRRDETPFLLDYWRLNLQGTKY